MNERITEAELADRNGWEAGWRNEIERNRGPVFTAEARFGLRLIAEVRRLRTIVVALDVAIEHASSGAVSAGERLVYLAEHVPSFFAEARRIRDEGVPSAPPARHVHQWIDVTTFEDPRGQEHEICSSSDGVPCPTPHRFIRYEARAIQEEQGRG